MPYFFNLKINLLYGPFSNAFSNSVYMTSISLPSSIELTHESITLGNCICVDRS